MCRGDYRARRMTEMEIMVPDEVPVMTLPNTAFFPQALMPLHIFESRYQTMLRDVLATNRLFAVAGIDPQKAAQKEEFEPPFRVATLGIVRSGQRGWRLVEAKEPRRFGRAHGPTVDRKSGDVLEEGRRRGDLFAIERDPSLGDHALDLTPRGDAGAGEQFGDSLRPAGCGGRRGRHRPTSLALAMRHRFALCSLR